MSGRVPLHGYNTNYRRHGEVFHIQTEDLGEPTQAVLTQVFSGGTILACRRQEYRHLLGQGDFEPRLRELMQKQHKAMLVGLRDGTLNHPEAKSRTPLPGLVRQPRDSHDTVQMTLPPEFYEESEESELNSRNDSGIIEDFPPEALPKVDTPVPQRPRLRSFSTPLPKASTPLPRARSNPPPAEGVGKPLSTLPTQGQTIGRVNRPAAATNRPQPAAVPAPVVPLHERPSLLKPKAERNAARPPSHNSSSGRIFSEISAPTRALGEEHLGERSLDEVILSYLSDELKEE